MSADHQVRIKFVNLSEKARGSSTLYSLLCARLLKGFVGGIVQPAEDFRGSSDHLEIAIAIHLSKGRRHQAQNIVICDCNGSICAPQRNFHRLSRPYVAGTDGGREN